MELTIEQEIMEYERLEKLSRGQPRAQEFQSVASLQESYGNAFSFFFDDRGRPKTGGSPPGTKKGSRHRPGEDAKRKAKNAGTWRNDNLPHPAISVNEGTAKGICGSFGFPTEAEFTRLMADVPVGGALPFERFEEFVGNGVTENGRCEGDGKLEVRVPDLWDYLVSEREFLAVERASHSQVHEVGRVAALPAPVVADGFSVAGGPVGSSHRNLGLADDVSPIQAWPLGMNGSTDRACSVYAREQAVGIVAVPTAPEHDPLSVAHLGVKYLGKPVPVSDKRTQFDVGLLDMIEEAPPVFWGSPVWFMNPRDFPEIKGVAVTETTPMGETSGILRRVVREVVPGSLRRAIDRTGDPGVRLVVRLLAGNHSLEKPAARRAVCELVELEPSLADWVCAHSDSLSAHPKWTCETILSAVRENAVPTGVNMSRFSKLTANTVRFSYLSASGLRYYLTVDAGGKVLSGFVLPNDGQSRKIHLASVYRGCLSFSPDRKPGGFKRLVKGLYPRCVAVHVQPSSGCATVTGARDESGRVQVVLGYGHVFGSLYCRAKLAILRYGGSLSFVLTRDLIRLGCLSQEFPAGRRLLAPLCPECHCHHTYLARSRCRGQGERDEFERKFGMPSKGDLPLLHMITSDWAWDTPPNISF